jgi:NitT/TauT family transport system permease protein
VLRRVLMPYLVAVNAAPKIAFAPLLLVWFGFGMSSKVVMAALIAFFPLLVNVVAGIAGTDPQKLRLMRSLAASGWMTFVKVKLPDAMPVIFAGLKTAIVFSVVGAVVGEFVGADAGLGHVIKQTDYQLDVPLTFALIVLLSLMGILLFYTIELIERRVLFWTSPQQ